MSSGDHIPTPEKRLEWQTLLERFYPEHVKHGACAEAHYQISLMHRYDLICNCGEALIISCKEEIWHPDLNN